MNSLSLNSSIFLCCCLLYEDVSEKMWCCLLHCRCVSSLTMLLFFLLTMQVMGTSRFCEVCQDSSQNDNIYCYYKEENCAGEGASKSITYENFGWWWLITLPGTAQCGRFVKPAERLDAGSWDYRDLEHITERTNKIAFLHFFSRYANSLAWIRELLRCVSGITLLRMSKKSQRYALYRPCHFYKKSILSQHPSLTPHAIS